MFMAKDESFESRMWDIISWLDWAELLDPDRRTVYEELPVMWRVDDTKQITGNIMWASSAQEIDWWHGSWKSPSLSEPSQ